MLDEEKRTKKEYDFSKSRPNTYLKTDELSPDIQALIHQARVETMDLMLKLFTDEKLLETVMMVCELDSEKFKIFKQELDSRFNQLNQEKRH